MKNIPDKIYLNINTPFKDVEDFNDLEGVTWSKDRTHVDISYYSLAVLKESFEAGIESFADYERFSGELQDFKDWYENNYLE